MKRSQSRSAPLDFGRARTYLGFTDRQLRRAVAERRVAHYKTGGGRGGGRLLFLVEDLDELLEAGRVEAKARRFA